MIKKIFLTLTFVLLFTFSVLAKSQTYTPCVPTATTTTPNLGLVQPGNCDINYGPELNNNAAILDTAISNLQTLYWGTWSNIVYYPKGALVLYDGIYYQSLIGQNYNLNPTLNVTSWGVVLDLTDLISPSSNIIGTGAPTIPCSGITNSLIFYTSTLSVLYQCSNANLTGTWQWNIIDPYTSPSLFNATAFPYYEVNGVQLASTNLLDTANLARLNVNNIFSAPGAQTASYWNAVNGFMVAGAQISSSNLSDGSNLAKINASNVFTGTTNSFVNTSASGVANGNVVDATTGFTINSLGPVNHIMLGNGSKYVDSATIPSSVISNLYYQTLQANGTPITQRSVLNFDTTLSATDGSGKSNVGLPSVMTPGTYVIPTSINVDAQGRVTSITNGVATPPVCGIYGGSYGCYRQNPDGSFEEWGTTTTFGGAGRGSFSLTYPKPFTNLTNLVIVFSPNTCDGGNAAYCADAPSGSPNDIYACMVMTPSLTAPTIVYSSDHGVTLTFIDSLGNTVSTGASCSWHAWGY